MHNGVEWVFQSTRPSWGETIGHAAAVPRIKISIHSPLAGRDSGTVGTAMSLERFQSTRPSRGETLYGIVISRSHQFQSTRPSRGETGLTRRRSSFRNNFNPLAPRGARPSMKRVIPAASLFQSTRPSRGETPAAHFFPQALRHFNPLAPRGARPTPCSGRWTMC